MLQVPWGVEAGILDVLLAPIINLLAQRTCTSVQSIFVEPGSETFDCECEGLFSMDTGAQTNIFCSLRSPICLLEETFCGTTSFEGKYGWRTGIASGEACLEIDAGFPGFPELSDLVAIPPLCIEAQTSKTSGLKFETCNVTIGGTACRNCVVCSTGVDVTFDCSNVNLSPIDTTIFDFTIPGPKVQQCVGIGLIPSIRSAANSVAVFGESSEAIP